MKNVYKNKVKINKKRKPLYPDEYKMKEINEKKKLKKMMDNYFNDYNKISKKLKITESPYILVSEKDYEDAVYNTDLMIRKWNDFYDMTPTYNPQVEDNYYNDSNIIFENTKNPLIKKDYKRRIEKLYPPPEEEMINSYNATFKSGKKSNMNFYNSIGVKNEEKKEVKNINEEDEYKFDENDKNINEEDEYKYDENDNIEESINKNKFKNINENKEKEYFYEEKEEIDNKDGPKLNNNKFNNYEENNDFEIEENIIGKKESNKKFKSNTENLPLLNDIIKDDTEKLPLLNDIIKDNSRNISKNNTFKNKTTEERKLKDSKDMLNYMEKEEIEDNIIQKNIPKGKNNENILKKSNTLKYDREIEKSKYKKSNSISLNQHIEIKKTNTVNEYDNSISEIKKSYTTKLNNKFKNRLSLSRENKLKKKHRKKKNFDPNDTIFDKMNNINENTKLITTAFNRNLIKNLNKRQKITSGWDSQNKNLIFIYIEKLYNNKRDVELLLIRYYSLRQKKRIIKLFLLDYFVIWEYYQLILLIELKLKDILRKL